MWTRADLKYRAKNALRGYFFAAVAVAFITGILCGDYSGKNNSARSSYNVQDTYNGLQRSGQGVVDSAADMIGDNIGGIFESPEYIISKIAGTGFGIIVMGMGIAMVLLGLAIGILIGNPIQVGSCRFFMSARQHSSRVGELFYAFRQREFWNVIFIMLVMNVKIFLWSLLLVIPGIVKSYEYGMIPYILSENPGISMTEAFALSREMTNGEKMNIFILDISFFPWTLLSTITVGLAGIFWVNPYIYATKAELYAVLRQRVLDSGCTNTYTLPGFGIYEERREF